MSPRQLTASLLSHLVEVEGIVTKASLKRPKLVKSVHYCERTAHFSSREYRDATSHEGLPTGAAYPTRDDDGNLLTTEFGLCTYRDHQVITLQARSLASPAGHHTFRTSSMGTFEQEAEPGPAVRSTQPCASAQRACSLLRCQTRAGAWACGEEHASAHPSCAASLLPGVQELPETA